MSVFIITYNHEKFIARAIESALEQDVNFPYQLVIGEDCSTDRTREIVLDYSRRYPAKIRLLLPERNIGYHANWVRTLAECHGEYVALLEGDDYWTSPTKLQRQVDYLDSHSECSMCFHPVMIVHEDGSEPPKPFPRTSKEISTIEDLVLYNYIPTAGTMFRSGLVDSFPNWIYDLAFVDWPTKVFVAQHGSIGYIDEVMGVYRIHGGAVWSTRNYENMMAETVKFYQYIDAYLDYRFRSVLKTKCGPIAHYLAWQRIKARDYSSARKYAWKYVTSTSPFAHARRNLAVLTAAHLPFVLDIRNAILSLLGQ